MGIGKREGASGGVRCRYTAGGRWMRSHGKRQTKERGRGVEVENGGAGDGWMVVLGVMPVPGCGRGPLGKASEGKANRWFANLLLGKKKKKSLTLKKSINQPRPKKKSLLPGWCAFWFFLWGAEG